MTKTRADLVQVIERNDYNEVKRYLDDLSNWQELCKEKYDYKILQAEYKSATVANYAGATNKFKALHALIDFMLEKKVNDEDDAYQLGANYCYIPISAEYNSSIPKHELLRKISQLNAKASWHLEKKLGLHCAIDYNCGKEVIEVLCEREELLKYQIKGEQITISVVFAAETNKWDAVLWIARKNPVHFAQYAKQVFEIGLKNKNYKGLIKVFSIKEYSHFFTDNLIEELVKTNSTNYWLHQLVQDNNLDIIKKLIPKINHTLKLSNVMSLVSPQHDNMTVLELACKSSSVSQFDVAEYLIANHTKIKEGKEQGMFSAQTTWNNRKAWHLPQALRWAVTNNLYTFVDWFLTYDSTFANDGSEELLSAIKNGNAKIVERLLEAKANININVNDEETFLIIAIKEACELLKKEKNESNNKEFEKAINQYTKIIASLFAYGAKVNSPDEKESRALILAVQNDALNLVENLLKYKPVLTVKNEENENLLFLAVQLRNIALIKMLVASGAPVNIKDGKECPALIYAIEMGDKDIVELLLNAGAAVKDCGFNGNKALYTAITKLTDRTDIVKLLLEKDADTESLNNGQKMEKYAEELGKMDYAWQIRAWRDKKKSYKLAFLQDFQYQMSQAKFSKTQRTGFMGLGERKLVDYQPEFVEKINKEIEKMNFLSEGKSSTGDEVFHTISDKKSSTIDEVLNTVRKELEANKSKYNGLQRQIVDELLQSANEVAEGKPFQGISNTLLQTITSTNASRRFSLPPETSTASIYVAMQQQPGVSLDVFSLVSVMDPAANQIAEQIQLPFPPPYPSVRQVSSVNRQTFQFGAPQQPVLQQQPPPLDLVPQYRPSNSNNKS